jgi:hypothetical protein
VAVPGAVSLERDPGSLLPGYSLQYLKIRKTPAIGEDAPGVETAELPIAAAWSVDFVAGIALILLGIALALLLPPLTHEHALTFIAVIFVVLGLGELWRSRFTPVQPDRLSIANAVMRARLDALETEDPDEIAWRVAEERKIGDLLLRMSLPTRNASPRSWAAQGTRDDEATPNRDRDPA